MRTTIAERITGASASTLFEQIAALDHYPAWMRLVHTVEPLAPDEGRPAWWVELRARVGPFTRSKQLRMVRTEHVLDERVRFERVQHDDREHAQWILAGEVAQAAGGAMLTMHLEYTGDLWSMNVLGRILDDEVRRSVAALTSLLAGARP